MVISYFFKEKNFFFIRLDCCIASLVNRNQHINTYSYLFTFKDTLNENFYSTPQIKKILFLFILISLSIQHLLTSKN